MELPGPKAYEHFRLGDFADGARWVCFARDREDAVYALHLRQETRELLDAGGLEGDLARSSCGRCAQRCARPSC